jgi:hypothetical protein
MYWKWRDSTRRAIGMRVRSNLPRWTSQLATRIIGPERLSRASGLLGVQATSSVDGRAMHVLPDLNAEAQVASFCSLESEHSTCRSWSLGTLFGEISDQRNYV